MGIKLHTGYIGGKKIAFSNKTEFLVQIGRYKSGYKTRYSFTGQLDRALFYYTCTNIGRGYKKRLLMPSSRKNPVLLRSLS